jgi:hypothetical protein
MIAEEDTRDSNLLSGVWWVAVCRKHKVGHRASSIDHGWVDFCCAWCEIEIGVWEGRRKGVWGHGDCPMQSKRAVGACIVGAAANKIGTSWSSWILILELCSRNNRELYLIIFHLPKLKRVMNQNLKSFFRRFLVFEKLMLMLYQCDFVFS